MFSPYFRSSLVFVFFLLIWSLGENLKHFSQPTHLVNRFVFAYLTIFVPHDILITHTLLVIF